MKETVVPIFNGVVEDKKLKIAKRDVMEKYIATLDKSKVEVVVRKKKRYRSNRQNSYYWGVVLPVFAEELGYTIDELHEALKWQFLKKHTKKLPTVSSTSELGTLEFINYLENVIKLAAENGIVIPPPDSVEYQ